MAVIYAKDAPADYDAIEWPIPSTERRLHLGTTDAGEDFTIPLDEAVSETFAHLAKRGMGKTHSALVRFELMVLAGALAVAIDPVGSWWGLRYGKDGGPQGGLPVYILGGAHGDVPIEKTAGKVIAEWILAARRPAVLDLKGFTDAEVRRFVADFAGHIYEHNTSPLHLFFDEADMIVPQEAPPKDDNDPRLRAIMNHLVRRGRHSGGIGVTLISQRPALIEKNVLTQVECLVVLRMTGPHDQAAIKEWIRHHQTSTESVLASLPSLPRGEAWIWSPGWLEFFGRVKIRDRLTFDSGATPAPGRARMPPRGPGAPVDLDKLRQEMAETVQRAEEKDPASLRRRLAEVTRERDELRARKPAVNPRVLQVCRDVLAASTDLVKLRDLLEHELSAAAAPTDTAALPADVAALFVALEQPRPPAPLVARPPVLAPADAPAPRPRPPRAPRFERREGADRILAVLAKHPTLALEPLGLLSQYVPSGGGFRTAMQDLKAAGDLRIEDGFATITPQGRSRKDLPTPLVGDALFEWWVTQQKEGAHRILRALRTAYPETLDAAKLAALAQFQVAGGGWRLHIKNLRNRLLIVNVGQGFRLNHVLLGEP